jgi:hypothetical protein
LLLTGEAGKRKPVAAIEMVDPNLKTHSVTVMGVLETHLVLSITPLGVLRWLQMLP